MHTPTYYNLCWTTIFPISVQLCPNFAPPSSGIDTINTCSIVTLSGYLPVIPIVGTALFEQMAHNQARSVLYWLSNMFFLSLLENVTYFEENLDVISNSLNVHRYVKHVTSFTYAYLKTYMFAGTVVYVQNIHKHRHA